MATPGQNIVVVPAGAQAATFNSSDFEMPTGGVGLILFLNISAATGTTPTLDVKVQGKDSISGNYVDVPGAAFAQKTGTGTSALVIHPAITASTNVAIAQVVPKTFRVVSTLGGTTPNFTMSISANLL